MRLTSTEYTEYARLGGIKWIRLFLQHSAEIHKQLELEKYDKDTKRIVKQNLRHHQGTRQLARDFESGRADEVVAFRQSKWQIVRELTQEDNS